eukprot:Nitzschia sp. Nitz4//scaffold183_size43938//39202//39945//NITZ4_007277-RA/size43938-processed-gene-0.10-mRNA-1//1//CDS//3329539635//9135//frame0
MLGRTTSSCGCVKGAVTGRKGRGNPLWWASRQVYRNIVSDYTEPPLDSTIVEKPCTVVLLEDSGYYETSWKEAFQHSFPKEYGMSFASLSFSSEDDLKGMVDELKVDLPPIVDAVFVTRGPIASWVTMYYLESFAVQGLVMVDPIHFDSFNQLTVKEDASSPPSQANASLWSQTCNRVLRLEPNSVPMLVFQSILDNPLHMSGAEAVARYHSDTEGPYGEIDVVPLKNQGDPRPAMEKINCWVDSIL